MARTTLAASTNSKTAWADRTGESLTLVLDIASSYARSSNFRHSLRVLCVCWCRLSYITVASADEANKKAKELGAEEIGWQRSLGNRLPLTRA